MKQKTVFVCQECGAKSPRWVGQCPECSKWNSMVEELFSSVQPLPTRLKLVGDGYDQPKPISSIETLEQERLKSGIEEFDRVLGGGAVPGSVALIGGEPGIGKSTLLLQVLDKMTQNYGKTLYVSGEESARQIKLRASRLGIESSELNVLCETDVEIIENHINKLSPKLVVIDSIQTMQRSDIESIPGNVTQVKESAMALTSIARSRGIPIFIVGHINKEGSIAGPKVMEHIVDTVLYMEGDSYHVYRILRAVKNRFGSTNEIGVFEMRDSGLVEVTNPSEMLLSERRENVSGSVVISIMQGTRPILLELQALVAPAYYGVPQRTANGIDRNRLALLLAVLDKRTGFRIQNSDVFVNIVGGMKAEEPGVDLGVMVAIVSNQKDKTVDPKTVVIGEVGLGGEVRAVSQAEKRIKESARLGFKRAIISHYNLRGLNIKEDIEVVGVQMVRDALSILL
ncbi:MAG: DNA repair protein RadA [Candidatus Poribacteria bacterium]